MILIVGRSLFSLPRITRLAFNPLDFPLIACQYLPCTQIKCIDLVQ